jgi:hypothetical protein
MQETRAFQGNQSLKKGQVFGAGQSSQEHPWTDKDYRRPSEPPLAGSMKRYLTESDPREEFRLGGQPTGNADVAEREDQINLSERRPKSSNEISRSNTVKKTNKGTTTNPSGADGNRSDGAESLDYLSPTKRRKKGNDGAGKTRKNQ